jgi:hypothetical protein
MTIEEAITLKSGLAELLTKICYQTPTDLTKQIVIVKSNISVSLSGSYKSSQLHRLCADITYMVDNENIYVNN